MPILEQLFMRQNDKTVVHELLNAVDHCYGTSQSDSLKANFERIIDNRGLANWPPTENKHTTILLSDIRGFTAITESYSAQAVVDLLNRYFTCMSEIIVKHGGTIDKFMGDSIMVLFGAPESQADDHERAINCAVEMQLAMTEFNQQSLVQGLPEIFIGIGINSGDVMAGTIGSDLHREYTVIGDEVNVVSRIEAQSLRGQILLSENTYKLAKDFIEVSSANTVKVKGKRQSITLYELFSTHKPHTLDVPRREIRNSPRALVNIPVFFQRLEGKTILPNFHQGEVVDLGYNGMQALIPVPLSPSSEIRISLSPHLLGDESSEIYCRVIKVVDESDTFRASMEFTFIEPQGQEAIKHYVDSMIF